MSIDGDRRTARGRWSVKAARRECENGYNLFPCHVEPLHDFLDARTGFEVLENSGTGIRVPLNTQAPLRLPGMLSTAGHCDRSGLAIIGSPSCSMQKRTAWAVM